MVGPAFCRIPSLGTDTRLRDSEDSAPAEYPPEQPGVDQEEDDGAAYGAEEAEMQAALEKELEEDEKAAQNGDAEMAGTEEAQATVNDDASDAGSEDLEQDSSDDDDEDDDEEGGDNEGDEDMEMADGADKTAQANGENKPAQGQPQSELMVH